MLTSRNVMRVTFNYVNSGKTTFICSGCYRRLLSTNQPHFEKRFLLPLKPSQRCLASTTPPSDKTKEEKPSLARKIQKAAAKLDVKVSMKGKKRVKTDFSKSYTENIFITASRAMNEYLLSYSDLENLKSSKRRSPYSEKPDITVYLRRDVEKKALDKYGGFEKLQLERKKYRQKIEQDNMTRRDYEKQHLDVNVETEYDEKPYIFSSKHAKGQQGITKSGAGKVVLSAIFVNSLNTLCKAIAWGYTGSHSMFAEMVHSMADTMNQMILAVGIHQSSKQPDLEHPYGWTNMRNVASLISGVGIFCVGAGLSIYHGIEGLIHPDAVESLYWAILVLGGSFLSEGGSCLVAINETRKQSKARGMGFIEYIWTGTDPSTNVVLLEDIAAILGVGIAATCMSISYYTSNPLADAVGSLMIGGLLGGVASFIIYTNTVTLVGKSIPWKKKVELIQELENDRVIRALHDVKATDMGSSSVKFKAEVDFDGREITRLYLENQDLEKMLSDVQKYQNIEELEQFMLEQGEKIVDTMGSEVDRIERNLKNKHPEIRHVDLEQL